MRHATPTLHCRWYAGLIVKVKYRGEEFGNDLQLEYWKGDTHIEVINKVQGTKKWCTSRKYQIGSIEINIFQVLQR